MIQFNLLPDVKLEYIKAKKTKRLVMVIASIVTFAAISVFALLFISVNVVNKNQLNKLSKNITDKSKEVTQIPDVNKMLTVQNQLNSLSALHKEKPVTTRLPVFVQQLTPKDVNISELEADFTEKTMTIEGTSQTLEAVNRFIDTLKFTEFKVGEEQKRSFSEVVLDTFERNEKEAVYTIKLKYDVAIFDSANDVKLIVPTRSSADSESIFKPEEKVKP